MDLLDRYLEAVKKHLPWQRQDDIIAELKANLEAQLEDKEAELGRPLNRGEVEAWLKQMGPPMHVAARYQPQQYLIGPAVFPAYWFVMRLATMWCMIIYSIVSAVVIVAGAPSETAVVEALLRVPGVLMTTAAWITLIFAVIEFAGTHFPEKCPSIAGIPINWSPAGLPPVVLQPAVGKKGRSYAQAVAEVVFGFIFLIWLLLIPKYPFLLMGPGIFYLLASPYHLAPIWVPFYWCVVGLHVLQLAWHSVELWRGTWQKARPALGVAMKAVGAIPLLVLLNAPDHVTLLLTNPALDQARHGATLNLINLWVYRSMLIILALAALQLVFGIGQMSLDAYRKRAAAMR